MIPIDAIELNKIQINTITNRTLYVPVTYFKSRFAVCKFSFETFGFLFIVLTSLYLRFIYFSVDFICRKQFFGCADSHDLSFIQYNDLVCIFYRRNSLRNDDLCSIRNFFPECFSNQRICLCIYRTCGVIQNQNLRFFQKCPCNTQTLLLSAGNIVSPCTIIV